MKSAERTVVKRILAVVTMLSVGIAVFRAEIPAKATSETKQQLEEAEREREALENERGNAQGNLDALSAERNTLRSQLGDLNEQLEEVAENLADLEARILSKQEEIEEKQREIEDARQALAEAIETEERQYEGMVLRLRRMYERSESSYLNALFSGSVAQFLIEADFYARVEAYDQKKLREFRENHAYIEEQEARLEFEERELETEKEELEGLRVNAESEHAKVSGLIGQAQAMIGQYSSEISEVEAEIAAADAEIRSKESDIAALKKKYEEELAMSRKAASSTWRDISEITFEESDRYLLANLIYCEAGGEPYDGQVAVGAVVINRVLSSVYPDTVTGVIYQRNQFSPVLDGHLALALAENRATENCYRAADEAMSGVTNVGTCVYFRTPIEGLTGIAIGGHIFY